MHPLARWPTVVSLLTVLALAACDGSDASSDSANPAAGRDRQGAARQAHDYESVERLGDLAGFGPNPRALDNDPETQLVAVDDTDSGTYLVYVTAKPDATVEQLRPLVEKVLKNWRRPK